MAAALIISPALGSGDFRSFNPKEDGASEGLGLMPHCCPDCRGQRNKTPQLTTSI